MNFASAIRFALRWRSVLASTCGALGLLLAASPASAQVSLTTLGTPYTQSFDTLLASGSATWTNNSTIPGWFHARTGTGTTIVANNGSSNAGNLYSYGTGTATERALGSLGSGNAAIGNLFWGVRLQNNTGATITQLDVSYTGEEWRNSAAAAQTIAFSYLVGSPTVTGTLAEFQSAGVAVPSLDFTSPITGGAAGALDGNLAANRVGLTFSITGLSIPNGTEVMLRWADPDHTGADHGLSIDDFAVTPQGGPPLPQLTIADVTQAETNAGGTTFTFAISLSAAAGPGGVTFDVATADGTAQDGNPATEDTDYVAQTSTAQTISAGSTGPYNFNVTVNGDTNLEGDETFFANVTNVTGASVADGQGQATILDDDAVSADVSISKTLDTAGPYVVGQSVTYTLLVANAGPSTATNITVTDTPSNLTITNVSGACVSFSPCTIASLASGANTSITVTATIDAAGAFDNSTTATATEPDPDGGDNSDNTGNGGTAGASADVSLTKTLDTAGPYTIGQTVTYTILVANAGPSTATNINVTDTPTNLTITNVSGACASFSPCTIASLASGANTSITVTATVDSSGAFSNSATANAVEADPNTGNNTASDGDVASQVNVVEVTKAVSGTFVQGTNITYTIVMTNNMTVNQPDNFGHEFTDILPAGLTLIPGSFTATSGTTGSVANIFFWDGAIPSAGTVTLTFQATISPTASGQICNQGQSIFDRDGDGQNEASELTDDPSTATVNDPTCFNAVQANVVEVTKAVSGTFVQGTNITYTIVMTNNMTVNQPDNFGHEFTDILPAGLTLIPGSFTATSGTTGSVANIFFWDGAIPSAGTVTLTFQATISATASGSICNQGQSIFDRNGDGQNEASELTDDPSTGTVNDPTCFNAVQANVVEVTKAVSGTFVQGTNIIYTIVMTNNMTVNQPDNFGHEFTDILPAGLTLIPGSFTATSGTTGSVANIFFWDGAIPSAGTVTLTFQATISATASGSICNQGQSIFDRNGDGQNEASELTDDPSTATVNDPTCFNAVQANVVEVTKAVSGTFVQGTNITYTIVMTNSMTVNQPDNFGHEFTDILPAGLTLVPGSFTATSGTTGSVANIFFWDGAIPSAGTVTLTFQATISPTASGQICNQGQSIFDRDGDGQNEASELTDDPSTATVNDPTCFNAVQANVVEVTKAVSGTFVQGSNITYTIVMTNSMTVNQPDNFGHEFTDILPSGLTLIPGSFTATSGTTGSVANIFFWDGAIPSAGTVTLTFQATISPTASGQICNQGQSIFDRDGDGQNEASELTDDPSTATVNDPTCFTVGVAAADLSVTVSDAPDPVAPASNLTYTITLNNAGPGNAAAASLTNPVPANTTFASLTSPGGWSCATPAVGATGTVTCTNALMAPGNAVFTLVVTVGAVAGGTVISDTATVASTTTDPNPGNNSASTTSTVSSPAGVSGTKAVGAAAAPGGSVTYTVVLSNTGSAAQGDNPGDEFTDVLPAGLILVSASATSGTAVANVGTNTVTWNGGIAAGGTVTITIQATVGANVSPGSSIVNQGTIQYDADGDGSNEATAPTDNPATGAAGDGTGFIVTGVVAPVAAIPATSLLAKLLLSALLALLAFAAVRRRVA